MIRLFRKISHDLMEKKPPANQEGTFGRPTSPAGRYLLYAIGEIILVVIGILIALQINNWNESRKRDKQEKLYLERLLLENKQDLVTFEKSIIDLQKGNQSIEDMANALHDSNSDDAILLNAVKEYLIYGCHYPFFNPSKSTFEDLSSTGNLGVIKDTKLRDIIVSHYANYKFTESNFQVNTNWALPIDAPFYVENNVLIFEPSSAFIFGKQPDSASMIELRKNKEKYFRNAAVHYWVNADCINLLSEVKEETLRLVEQLENEIE